MIPEQHQHYANNWNIVTTQLNAWGDNPKLISEYDLTPTTSKVITQALLVVRVFSAIGVPPPERILPDGEGGVRFEYAGNNAFAVFSVENDLQLKYSVYDKEKK